MKEKCWWLILHWQLGPHTVAQPVTWIPEDSISRLGCTAYTVAMHGNSVGQFLGLVISTSNRLQYANKTMQNLKYFSIKYLLYILLHSYYVGNYIFHLLLQLDGITFLLNSFYLYMYDFDSVLKLSLFIIFLTEFQMILHLCIRNFLLKSPNHRMSKVGKVHSVPIWSNLPGQTVSIQITLHRNVSEWFLIISSEGNSTNSQGKYNFLIVMIRVP